MKSSLGSAWGGGILGGVGEGGDSSGMVGIGSYRPIELPFSDMAGSRVQGHSNQSEANSIHVKPEVLASGYFQHCHILLHLKINN